MKIGQSFKVEDENERQDACRAAKYLRDAGVIAFKIVTSKIEGGGFTVVAITE